MLSTKEFNRLLKLAKKVSELKNDTERYKFILANKKDVYVWLDNDDSYFTLDGGVFTDDTQSDLISDACGDGGNFEDYFGNGAGTENFFAYLGIKSGGV